MSIEIEINRWGLTRKRLEEEKKLRIKKIKCSLPINCFMKSKQFGDGRLVEYNESSMIMSVKFGDKIVRFQYPNAILDNYLILAEYALDLVKRDISEAEKG